MMFALSTLVAVCNIVSIVFVNEVYTGGTRFGNMAKDTRRVCSDNSEVVRPIESIIKCAAECSRVGSCNAFAYMNLEKLCLTYNTDENDASNLEPASGWVYFEKVFIDCSELHSAGTKENGVYTISPGDGSSELKAYCDMVTDGGGWTVFQRRQDGSEDFYLDWNDYKNGFGNLVTEFWLGNDNIYRLTHQDTYQLRVDLEDHEGNKAYASYHSFSIASESFNYTLTVGGYSGGAGDSLTYQNGQSFSTKDRDNDPDSRNCAVLYKGAWWYSTCHDSNLNGQYGNTNYAEGVNWNRFKGLFYSLKRTSMKIRPVGFTPAI